MLAKLPRAAPLLSLLVLIVTASPWQQRNASQRQFKESAKTDAKTDACLEVDLAYSRGGVIGLFADSHPIYRKIDLFTRYIGPHQVGAWLADNVADKHGGQGLVPF